MNNNGQRHHLLGLVAGLCLIFMGNLASAEYPQRAVRLMIGFTPGGGADTVGRILATKLSERWKQPVTVENKAGANGVIAADTVAHAAPDGYTLLFGTNTREMIDRVIQQPTGWLAPITEVGGITDVLIVPASLGINSMADFIKYAKANPGKLTSGDPGTTSSAFLAMEMLKKMAGIDIVETPYKGGAAAMVGLLGGEIQAVFSNPITFQEYLKAGKVRALGVGAARGLPSMPEIPSVAKAANLPEFDVHGVWYFVMAPAGVPEDIAAKINKDIGEIVNSPDMKERLNQFGASPISGTPKQLLDAIAEDNKIWSYLPPAK